MTDRTKKEWNRKLKEFKHNENIKSFLGKI